MYRQARARCPQCRIDLEVHDDKQLCARCRGVWVDEGDLLYTLRRRHPGRMVKELLEHNDGSPRRDCPVCGERMNLVWLETLQFDRCAEHGVWLDRGELERALTYDFPLDHVKPPRSDPT